MNRRKFLRSLSGGALAAARSLEAAPSSKPNFVFILIDDLGWRDLACFGSQSYETPNIDRLAGQGMKFTSAYAAAPVCSPTRASIMTGKAPARLNITYALGGLPRARPTERLMGPDLAPGLPLSEVTIAEALHTAGYVSALVGKWHLGGPDLLPDKQGFDVNVAGNHVGMVQSFFYPRWKEGSVDPAIVRGAVPLNGKPGDYLTDRLTDEATKFIEEHQSAPFLLYLAHYAVHIPLEAKQEMIARFKAKQTMDPLQPNPIYAAMIQSVDESVGKVLAKLDELKLSSRTVVIFMSDNGGLSDKEGPNTPATSNAPLREGKHFLYEGGIREPMIVKWPGVVQPGSTCDVPVISNDFYPTMVEMAGIRKDPGHPLDGVSIVPLLRQKGSLKREALFWHAPHYGKHGAKPGSAVRKGNYKLIEFFDPEGVELYDLSADIGEKNNLAESMPAKVAELRKLLDAWRRSVGARMMKPNPAYMHKPQSGSQ